MGYLKEVFDDTWIYHNDNGDFQDLLVKTVKGYQKFTEEENIVFANEQDVIDHYNDTNLFKSAMKKKKKTSGGNVNGYLTSVDVPFAVEHESGLPAFKKAEAHTQVFAAGYYILNRVEAGSGWMRSFCPKIETLLNNEYAGPFSSELEQLSMLNVKKKQTEATD